ncbi:MAG TPA: Dyp-type peroxidase [Conexibacter sp.]|jgi:deferrochelatase/peroxidase EfeB
MSKIDRRRFLSGSALALGGASLGVGAQAALGAAAAPADDAPAMPAAPPQDSTLRQRVPFDGAHQPGIVEPQANVAIVVALDAIAPDAIALANGLRSLSGRARELMAGGEVTALYAESPPSDSGTLGTEIEPDALTVTVAFGSTLFDGRYGFADKRPARLTTMPSFPNDALDQALCGGDVLLTIAGGHHDTVSHALRELLRVTRAELAPIWWTNGFTGAQRGPTPRSAPRNHFGFRDGTGNPDPTDAALMDRLVWVQPGTPGEPAWTAGGTYQVVRNIRMHVEFWDRVGLREQESMIGRRRDNGAPLGGTDEFEDPSYDVDLRGVRIPLDAHIRLANPRKPTTEDKRILRRGWSYDRGLDSAGQLDMGLLFVAFNQDVERQFVRIQHRLDAEPMIDYVTPVGGGYFFVPPGTRGVSDFVGSALFAA